MENFTTQGARQFFATPLSVLNEALGAHYLQAVKKNKHEQSEQRGNFREKGKLESK